MVTNLRKKGPDILFNLLFQITKIKIVYILLSKNNNLLSLGSKMAVPTDWKTLLPDCSTSPFPSRYKGTGVCECLDGSDEGPNTCTNIQAIITEACDSTGHLSRLLYRMVEEDELLRTAASLIIIGGSVYTLKLIYR